MNEPLKPEDVTPDTFPRAGKIPILTGLPEYLKDRTSYKKILKEIYEMRGSRCSHSDPAEWYNCVKCAIRFRDYQAFMKKLGFRDPAQFMAWRRTHEEIERRVPLR